MAQTYGEALADAKARGDRAEYERLRKEGLQQLKERKSRAPQIAAATSPQDIMSTMGSYGESMMDSATFGLGGEIQGAAGSLLKKLGGDQRPLGVIYAEQEKAFDTRVTRQRKEAPVSTFITDMVGSAGLGGVVGMGLKAGRTTGTLAERALGVLFGTPQHIAKGAGAGGRAVRAAQTGAAQGAAQTLGEAEDLSDVVTPQFWQQAALNAGLGAGLSYGGSVALEGIGRAVQAIGEKITGRREAATIQRAYDEYMSSPAFAEHRTNMLNSLRNDFDLPEDSSARAIQDALQLRVSRATGRTGAQALSGNAVGAAPTTDRMLRQAHLHAAEMSGGLSNESINMINHVKDELRDGGREILYHIQGQSPVSSTGFRAFDPDVPMRAMNTALRERWHTMAQGWQRDYGADSAVASYINDVIARSTDDAAWATMRNTPIDQVFDRYHNHVRTTISQRLFERVKNVKFKLSDQYVRTDDEFLRGVPSLWGQAMGGGNDAGTQAWQQYLGRVNNEMQMRGLLPAGAEWRGTPNQIKWLIAEQPDLAAPVVRLWHLQDLTRRTGRGMDELNQMMNAVNPDAQTARVVGGQADPLNDFRAIEDMQTWNNLNIATNEQLGRALGPPGRDMGGGAFMRASDAVDFKNRVDGWIGDESLRALYRGSTSERGVLAYWKAARQLHGDLMRQKERYDMGRQGYPTGTPTQARATAFNREVEDLKEGLRSTDKGVRDQARRELETIRLGTIDNALAELRRNVRPLEAPGETNLARELMSKEAIDRVAATVPEGMAGAGQLGDGIRLVRSLYDAKLRWMRDVGRSQDYNTSAWNASNAMTNGITNTLQFIGESMSGWFNLQRSGEAKRSLDLAMQMIQRQGQSRYIAQNVRNVQDLMEYIDRLENVQGLGLGVPRAGFAGSVVGAQAGGRATLGEQEATAARGRQALPMVNFGN